MSLLPLSSDLFENRDFNYALSASILLHIIVIVIFLFGIPSFIHNRFEENDVMTFDILPLSAISNVEEESPKIDDNKSTIPKEDGKKNITKAIETSQDNAQEQNISPKIIEDKKVIQQEVIPEPKEAKLIPKEQQQEPIDIPKKIEAKPKALAKSQSKTQKDILKTNSQKKVNNVAKKQKSGDDIDSLLNDLEQSAGNNKQSNLVASNSTEGIKYTRSGVYDDDSPLSITEKMLVKNQIKRNWQPPVGSQYIDNIKVSLQMKLNKDGSVNSVNIIRVQCPMGADYTCQLVAESAIRAVKKTSPFANLLPDRYDVWQYFNVIFDPGD